MNNNIIKRKGYDVMNNKGITLIELIVSFILVGITAIYFMEVIVIIRKVYITTQKDTNKFVSKAYAIKVFDKCKDLYPTDNTKCTGAALGIDYNIGNGGNGTVVYSNAGKQIKKYNFQQDGTTKFYLYRCE